MNDPIDFHTANTVLDQHPDMRYPLVIRFFFLGQCIVAWLLLGLEEDHAWQCEPLKPRILRQHTPFWQAILGFICDPFIVGFPYIGHAQEPDASGRINDQHIFDGMVLLLATIVDFLLIRILRTCYWSFGAIMTEKRGASGSSSSSSARNCSASSAAVRAGKSRWPAKASSKISSNSRTHLLTFG
jgi:hypothetical protein